MIVKKLTQGSLSSQGYNFEYNKEVEVTDKVANYLQATFKDMFEIVTGKKVVLTEGDAIADLEGRERPDNPSKKTKAKPKRGRAKKAE